MAAETTKLTPEQESRQAQSLAARYRCEYVDLREGKIDHDLFHSVPVDLMFRYNFVPLHANNGTLEIALADPRNLNLIDELSIVLKKKLRVKVATLTRSFFLSTIDSSSIRFNLRGSASAISSVPFWACSGTKL